MLALAAPVTLGIFCLIPEHLQVIHDTMLETWNSFVEFLDVWLLTRVQILLYMIHDAGCV